MRSQWYSLRPAALNRLGSFGCLSPSYLGHPAKVRWSSGLCFCYGPLAERSAIAPNTTTTAIRTAHSSAGCFSVKGRSSGRDCQAFILLSNLARLAPVMFLGALVEGRRRDRAGGRAG